MQQSLLDMGMTYAHVSIDMRVVRNNQAGVLEQTRVIQQYNCAPRWNAYHTVIRWLHCEADDRLGSGSICDRSIRRLDRNI